MSVRFGDFVLLKRTILREWLDLTILGRLGYECQLEEHGEYTDRSNCCSFQNLVLLPLLFVSLRALLQVFSEVPTGRWLLESEKKIVGRRYWQKTRQEKGRGREREREKETECESVCASVRLEFCVVCSNSETERMRE